MSKHTPGPWIAHAGVIGGTSAIWEGESVVAITKPHPDEQLRARLITAAPDMLKLLKAIVKHLEGPEDKGGYYLKVKPQSQMHAFIRELVERASGPARSVKEHKE